MYNIFKMVNERLNELLSKNNESIYCNLDYYQDSSNIRVYKKENKITKMIYIIDLFELSNSTKITNPDSLSSICYFVIKKSIGGEINGTK
jgi:hypothetical protein